MLKKLLKKDQGFTLIEVVIVLAIAALIILIVLLAISGAQRTRRDTTRQSDVGSIAAAAEAYASNHNGDYPNSQALLDGALTNGAAGGSCGVNICDPLTGTKPAYSAAAATATAPLNFAVGSACAGHTANPRTWVINYWVENGGTAACRDNT